jgi:hypothetical protein
MKLNRPRILSSIICTVFCLETYAQPPATSERLLLRFAPIADGKELTLQNTTEEGEAGLRITTMRCYISGISIWQNDLQVWKEEHSYHLLDAEQPESLLLSLSVPSNLQYNTIRFNLGIDSATSASGAHGGDLDPAKGMYWAWQSGYINFKLEGTSPQSTARKHAFHFHLGGYQYPYVSLQPVALRVKPSQAFIIRMDMTRFLSGIDLAKQNSIMIPGAEAYLLSKKAAGIFEATAQ